MSSRHQQELRQRNAGVVAEREIERLTVILDGRKGAVAGADAAKQAAETRLSTLLPAQKASADAALKQAQVELDKTVVYAGVSAWWSSSRCASATSSIRSCARRAADPRGSGAPGNSRPASTRSKRK